MINNILILASKPNGDIYKDSALTVEAIQVWNGNISYISIDGKEVPYSDYNDNKTMFTKNEKREVTSWKHTVRIKPYVMEKLTLAYHRIAMVCAGESYRTQDKVLVDSVTFN
jgi:hypothetical protein